MATMGLKEEARIPTHARICPNCGARLQWASTSTGEWIPVDKVSKKAHQPSHLWNRNLMVSHYDSCAVAARRRKNQSNRGRIRGNAVMKYAKGKEVEPTCPRRLTARDAR